jgi:hypothetical protein
MFTRIDVWRTIFVAGFAQKREKIARIRCLCLVPDGIVLGQHFQASDLLRLHESSSSCNGTGCRTHTEMRNAKDAFGNMVMQPVEVRDNGTCLNRSTGAGRTRSRG